MSQRVFHLLFTGERSGRDAGVAAHLIVTSPSTALYRQVDSLNLVIRAIPLPASASPALGHGHLGVLGVTGFLMKDLAANPLDYVEGGPLNQRRVELSAILDSTSADLSAFHKRAGKLIVVIDTDDTLALRGRKRLTTNP
jgi:hypothetical protein